MFAVPEEAGHANPGARAPADNDPHWGCGNTFFLVLWVDANDEPPQTTIPAENMIFVADGTCPNHTPQPDGWCEVDDWIDGHPFWFAARSASANVGVTYFEIPSGLYHARCGYFDAFHVYIFESDEYQGTNDHPTQRQDIWIRSGDSNVPPDNLVGLDDFVRFSGALDSALDEYDYDGDFVVELDDFIQFQSWLDSECDCNR